MAIEQLALRAEPKAQTLSGEAYTKYLEGLRYIRAEYQKAALAIPYFEQTIQLAPQSALGYAGLAEALYNAGSMKGDTSEFGRAQEAIARAEQLDPQSAHAHLIAGRFEAFNARYQRALAEYQLALEIDPKLTEAWIAMAYALFYLGRLPETEAAFRSAIAAQPGYYKPFVDFGLYYYELRDFARAEQQWAEAYRLAPGLTRARLNLSLLYQLTGRPAEALRMAQEAVAIRRTADELEMLGDLQPAVEAVKSYEEAVRVGPVRYTSWASLAGAYVSLRREGDAAGAFRSGLHFVQDRLRDRPSDPEIVAWCAYYHARLGENDLARTTAAQAEKMKSLQGSVRRQLILTYGWINDVEAANRLLDGARPDLIKELSKARDLPPALRGDPRFARN